MKADVQRYSQSCKQNSKNIQTDWKKDRRVRCDTEVGYFGSGIHRGHEKLE